MLVVLWVPLYRLTIIGRNFHAKQLWMTQSAGGPHNSFQPIIQMESAIQTGSLHVSFLSLHSPGQVCSRCRASHLFHTSQDSQTVICCHCGSTWERMSLAVPPKTTQSPIKAAVWGAAGVIVEEMMARQRFLSLRDCVVSAEHPASGLRKCQYLFLWEASVCDALKA